MLLFESVRFYIYILMTVSFLFSEIKNFGSNRLKRMVKNFDYTVLVKNFFC